MFLESSRYFDVKTVSTKTADGRTVTAIRLRHLPYVAGTPTVIKQNDRLDVIAQRKYGDPTKFWHVADANTELEAEKLTTERPQSEEVLTIYVPEK